MKALQLHRRHLLVGLSLLLTLILSITGCNRKDEPNSEADAPVQSDVEALSDYMTLPDEPAEVRWVRFRSDTNPLLPSPNYRVIAVLRYDAETITQLQNEVLYLVRSNVTLGPTIMSPWFPEPLKAAISEKEGEVITAYHAKPFYKLPYGQGSVYFIGEYVVVELRTETW